MSFEPSSLTARKPSLDREPYALRIFFFSSPFRPSDHIVSARPSVGISLLSSLLFFTCRTDGRDTMQVFRRRARKINRRGRERQTLKEKKKTHTELRNVIATRRCYENYYFRNRLVPDSWFSKCTGGFITRVIHGKTDTGLCARKSVRAYTRACILRRKNDSYLFLPTHAARGTRRLKSIYYRTHFESATEGRKISVSRGGMRFELFFDDDFCPVRSSTARTNHGENARARLGNDQ